MCLSLQAKKSINHLNFFILLSFLLTILKIPNGFCQTIFSLSNGAELSYQTGQLDLLDYTGEMEDVIYYKRNGEVITAENVKITTDDNIQNKNTIYKLVEIRRSKLSSRNQQFSLSAELLELRDLPQSLIGHLLKITNQNFNGKHFYHRSDNDFALLSSSLQLLGVKFEREGILAKTKGIKASIYPKRNISENNIPTTEFKLNLKNTEITPIGDSNIASNFASFLSGLGLSALNLSLEADSQFFEENQIQHFQLSIKLEANNLMRIKINLHVGITAPEKLPNFLDATLLKSVLPHAKLHLIELEIKDLGLNSRLPDAGLVRYHEASDNVYKALIKLMPKNGKTVAKPLKLFSYNGGTLSLISRPSSPKPIAMITSMFLFPELLVEEFAISSLHVP